MAEEKRRCSGAEVSEKRRRSREEGDALVRADIAEWMKRGCPQVPLSVQVQWVLAVIGLRKVDQVGCPCPQARRLLRWAGKNRERFRVEYEQRFRPPESREYRVPVEGVEQGSGDAALEFLDSLKGSSDGDGKGDEGGVG